MTGHDEGAVHVRLRRAATSTNTEPVSVLLLHGMGAGANSWDRLAALLAPDLELWDVDLPWSTSGGSAWAWHADVASWVSVAVDQLKIELRRPPDVVVAHSFAANALLELLSQRGPLWTIPVVLISPFYRSTPMDFHWSSINYYVEGFHRMLNEGIRLRAGTRVDDETRSMMAARLCELMGPYPWLRFYDTYLRTPFLDVERLTVPVLLVGGTDDHGATADGVRALGAQMPNTQLEMLEHCGHFPMTEQPFEIAELIENFALHVRSDTSDGPAGLGRSQRRNHATNLTLERRQ